MPVAKNHARAALPSARDPGGAGTTSHRLLRGLGPSPAPPAPRGRDSGGRGPAVPARRSPCSARRGPARRRARRRRLPPSPWARRGGSRWVSPRGSNAPTAKPSGSSPVLRGRQAAHWPRLTRLSGDVTGAAVASPAACGACRARPWGNPARPPCPGAEGQRQAALGWRQRERGKVNSWHLCLSREVTKGTVGGEKPQQTKQ